MWRWQHAQRRADARRARETLCGRRRSELVLATLRKRGAGCHRPSWLAAVTRAMRVANPFVNTSRAMSTVNAGTRLNSKRRTCGTFGLTSFA